ncbi:MAG: dTDP-4-dehydrorhamnose reductase [Alphaproteobacteria bacterium]|nr:dTDP-4-dehydrorhamnose reductase [Alphaproteobacteria bacterium]
MKVLVLGKTGQLARELARAAWPAGWQTEFAGCDQINLSIPENSAEAIADRKPSLVINAAAYTAVDKAESEPELAMRINALAPGAIASACASSNIPFVTVSTDYVFDGSKNGPYWEDDPISPVSAYGRSKAEGERLTRAANDLHLILRTSWVFSATGANFVRTMLRLAAERETLDIVADQRGCPTAAADLAAAIVKASAAMMSNPALAGTYHVANAGAVTWYNFAAAIFEQATARGKRAPALRAISSSEYPTPARRPANSELATAKFESAFGHTFRHWRAPLAEVLDELLAPV